VKDAIYVAGGLVVIAFFIVRQRRSDRFRERSLLFPIGLGIYGAVLLNDTAKRHPLTPGSAALLTMSAVASVAFGLVRGRTIELFVRDGELWERATWTTIVAGWGGLVVVRVGLIVAAAVAGAQLAASATSIPLMLAVTLATQMIVVRQRARESGVAIASSPGRRRRRRRART